MAPAPSIRHLASPSSFGIQVVADNGRLWDIDPQVFLLCKRCFRSDIVGFLHRQDRILEDCLTGLASCDSRDDGSAVDTNNTTTWISVVGRQCNVPYSHPHYAVSPSCR
jgi:hypothetical protein